MRTELVKSESVNFHCIQNTLKLHLKITNLFSSWFCKQLIWAKFGWIVIFVSVGLTYESTVLFWLEWKLLVTQSCITLWDPLDCSPPGSSVHGILQARILELVAILFSRGNLPDAAIKPGSLALQADSLLPEPPRKTRVGGVWTILDGFRWNGLAVLSVVFPAG